MNQLGLLTESEAAKELRVCPRTLRRLRQRGEIRFVAVTARTVAYRQEDLQAFVEKRTRLCDERVPTRRKGPRRERQGDNVVSFLDRRAQRRATA